MNAFARKTLIFVAVMAAVALVGGLGRKFYQKTTEHRLVTEAGKYLETQDFKNAGLCLERALQINPVNATANQLMADVLEAGGSPLALNWRIRTAQIQTNNVEYRLAWAQTALKMNELPSAVQALRGVDEKHRSTAAFHKLAGALAWNVHDVRNAEKEFSEALRLEPTNPAVALNLATVRLVSTNPEAADQARLSLEKIPASSPLHLTAIRYLATDAATHKSFERALFYSRQVISDPKAAYVDKLAHLQLLHAAGNPEFSVWKGTLEKDALHSPNQAYALGHWIQLAESPATALQWLRTLPADEQTNLPVPLAVTDCQIAMKDWPGLLAEVGKRSWAELDFYQLSLESLADRSLGKDLNAENAWQRALVLSSHRLDRLTRLDQLTASWKWAPERSDVLREIVSEFPKETWAGEQLVAVLYAEGKTRTMADVLEKMSAADPSNVHLKNNLATVLLLLRSDLGKAHRLALESYNSSPENPFFACTYAYSLLLQSRNGEAAQVLASLKGEYLKNPSIAAYYGVVEAGAGNKNVAKEPLKLAGTARLLPEEMTLVHQADAGL